MKRKGIIISIIGIIIVALSLLGITFGYYYTQIFGNENATSVKVTSAMKAIKYIELSEEVSGTVIKPGYEYIKTFAATSLSTEEEIYHIYLDEVINEFTRTQDITYTLYRKSGNNTIDTSNLSDCEEISSGIFPKTNSYIKFNEKLLTKGDSYTYALKINYLDSSEEQDIDDGKTFGFKVQLHSEIVNPYKSDTTLLAYNIINNAMSVTETQKSNGYAELVSSTPTVVAKEISGDNESVMAATADEYGTSYYYRGAVKNNYLEFNGMCWRIVRIEGDGSIKITLAAQKACSQITAEDTGSAFIGTGDYGYKRDYSYYADYENSTNNTSSMKYKFNIFLNGGSFDSYDSNGEHETKTYTAWSATNLGKLKSEEVCIGDTESAYTSAGVLMTEAEKQAAISNYQIIYYKNYIRMYTDQIATLMCDTSGNKTTSAKIYPLTADEVVFAGGKVGANNYTYYLRDNATSGYWWTLSPAFFYSVIGGDYAFSVDTLGYVYGDYNVSDADGSLRPAVSLASGAKISTGDGTKDSPYTIQ